MLYDTSTDKINIYNGNERQVKSDLHENTKTLKIEQLHEHL